MRGVLGQTVIGFPAPDYKTPEAALAGAETFLKAYADDPLIIPAVAPHAIYTTSDETLKAARALADRYGKPLIIHWRRPRPISTRRCRSARRRLSRRSPIWAF